MEVSTSKHRFESGDKVKVKWDIAGKIKKGEVVEIVELLGRECNNPLLTSYTVTKSGLENPIYVADHEIEKL